MTDHIIAKYLENDKWPICKSNGREKKCGDNFGDIECPFCDRVLCAEGQTLSIGDSCKSCGGVVVRFVG